MRPPFLAAPTLVTDRLTLRAHVPDDLAACVAMWSDPDVIRHVGNRPASIETAWARVLRYVGHWTALGFGFWIVHETSTGAFVGEVGLADFKRNIAPEFASALEAGWVLARAAHGRGLATEAMRAALAWSDAHLAGARVTAVIEPANTASIAVATKCGFRRIGETPYEGDVIDVFERAAR